MKHNFYSNLKKLDYFPEIIVDCGAATGQWSSMIRSIFPNSIVLAIDASDWCKGSIPGASITEIQVLSDEQDKECIFYKKKENIDNNTFCTGDSLFKEKSQHYQVHNTLEFSVKTQTLYSLLKKHSLNKIDLLKIDTQGSELIILKGLKELLQNVQFIELECSIIDYNENGCSFSDIITFLSPNFSLFDIIETTRSHQSTYDITKQEKNGDFLFQMDVVFKNNQFKI